MNVDLPEAMADRLPVRLEVNGTQCKESLRFELWQMLDELFCREIVFLMRHGPADWSMRDAKDVGPTDCADQRLQTYDGADRMHDLGLLLAANDIRPASIVTSEWCRDQVTRGAVVDGMSVIAPNYTEGIDLVTDPALNLLLSLQGVPAVEDLRTLISSRDGGDGNGPPLVISHFINIEELTDLSAYEGEMPMIDPKRDNRIPGYVRLQSAVPDVRHFQ